MSEQKKNLPVVVPSKQELQKQLKRTIADIDKKLKTLGSDATIQFLAPSQFKYNELDPNVINIHTHIDVIYLAKALAKMNRIKKEYEATMNEVGINKYPICTWYAAPVDYWIHDLTFRLKIVSNQSLINQLTASKVKLQNFLSEDEKLLNTLTEVAALAKL